MLLNALAILFPLARRARWLFILGGFVLASGLTVATGSSNASSPSSVHISFSRQVHPILQRHCQGCHQPASAGGGLILSTYAGFLKGGSGQAFKPGDSTHSLVMQLITGDPPAMPKNAAPLSKRDVETIRRWIEQGAHDDTVSARDAVDSDHPPVYRTLPEVSSLSYSPDGARIAVAGYHEVTLHRASDGALLSRLVGPATTIESVAFSPDGRWLAAAGGTPAGWGQIQFWDPKTSKLIHAVDITSDTLFGLSFSGDGKEVAVGTADDSVRVLTVPEGRQLIRFDNHSDWVLGTVFTRDGRHLVSAGRDQALKLILLEGDTGSFIDDINTHYAPLRCLVRLPGEDRVVCGEDDGVVRLYQVFRTTARTMNMEDHNLVRSFDALPSAITALAVSGDGKRVAAGDLDGHLRLFDVATGRILASVTTYRRGIFALGFSPDGSSLAMAGFDGRVRIVSSTGRLLFSFIPVPLGSGPASRGAVLTASGPGSRSRSGSPGPTAHTLPPGRNAHG